MKFHDAIYSAATFSQGVVKQPPMQRFVDEVVINIKSGDGGPGAVSFRREKFIPRGKADGGNGGNGGDIILNTNKSLKTLYHLKGKHGFIAKNGDKGNRKDKFGKKGESVTIEVPPGSLVTDEETGVQIIDLAESGQTYTILKGGKGGKGNAFFSSSRMRSPKFAQPGEPGLELKIRIELKIIADVGIVGFPNAGKSTFLSVISKAQPKIANYPFTTIIPNLGMVTVENKQIVFVDIPGLIENASKGAGLGFKFLKHIERTRLLLFLIDMESDEYLEQYNKLCLEMNNFSNNIIKKTRLIACSKYDLAESKNRFHELKDKIAANTEFEYKEYIFPLSSISHFGINDILKKICELLT